MEEQMHRLFIEQDEGNFLVRLYHNIKPETFNHCKVQVKDLRSQGVVDYDKYHQDFPNGDYALLFYSESGERLGVKEIHLDQKTSEEVWIVFKYAQWLGIFSADVVDAGTFKAKLDANRLLYPRGFNGY